MTDKEKQRENMNDVRLVPIDHDDEDRLQELLIQAQNLMYESH